MVETATKKGKALQRAFPFQNAAMLRPATACDIQACVLFAFTLAKNPKPPKKQLRPVNVKYKAAFMPYLHHQHT